MEEASKRIEQEIYEIYDKNNLNTTPYHLHTVFIKNDRHNQFYSYIKNFNDNRWLKYSDTDVSPV